MLLDRIISQGKIIMYKDLIIILDKIILHVPNPVHLIILGLVVVAIGLDQQRDRRAPTEVPLQVEEVRLVEETNLVSISKSI